MIFIQFSAYVFILQQALTLTGKSWKTHPEFFLKFSFSGSSHRLFYWKTHPISFSKFQFWGVTQAVLLENSSIKNHEYLFSFFSILGRHTGRFTGKLIQTKFYISHMVSVKKIEWMSFPVKRCLWRPRIEKTEWVRKLMIWQTHNF